MKFVQTFWSKPGIGNSLMDIRAGWRSPEYHWMSWALSCLQVKSFYKDVELVTDERGKEILINRLQLPYTSVRTNLEVSLDAYPNELWSLAKIFSYSIQDEPFVHLDGDVFIWKPFEESFLQSGLLAQNVEMDIPYYRNMLVEINKRLKFVPAPFLFSASTIYASNTGIFGGHNIAFIKEYCRQAFEFVDKNLPDIANLPAIGRPLLNFIFEQYLLFYLATGKGLDISYFIKEPVTDPAYQDYARILDIPNVSLVHPVGDYKKRPFTCTQMAWRLRKEYPDYYYRVLDECKKDMQIINQFYYFFEESPSEVYRKILANETPVISMAEQHILETLSPAESLAVTWAAMDHNDDRSKQLFTEISELESQRQTIFKLLNQPAQLTRMYAEAIHQYRLVAGLFAQEFNDTFLNTTIYLNKDVVLIELSRKWELPAPADITGFISDKLKEEAGLEQLALWIEPEMAEINEMYLSHVEIIIVSTADSPISIRDILHEARQFFDVEEMEKNPGQYDHTIINSIKHLLYSHILYVE